ncbi:hypothetical protein [Sphingosinithalassobacter portus]|uniref:hypothetical protein n=1 Tax=Stakelama portus TaxID=2676234 RepID=UPI0011AB6DFB|nr:hypothetical protein [Sphingosinithalassobacter portus]
MISGRFWWVASSALVLALTACNLDRRADEAVAVGTAAQMDDAIKAARDCAIPAVRSDPLDDEQVLLLISSNSSAEARSCLFSWFRKNMPDAELTPQKRKMIGID